MTTGTVGIHGDVPDLAAKSLHAANDAPVGDDAPTHTGAECDEHEIASLDTARHGFAVGGAVGVVLDDDRHGEM